MIIQAQFGIQDAEERCEFNPEEGDYSDRDRRPYAWRSAEGGKALIECRDSRLFIDGRQVRIFEPEPDMLRWMKFRDMRQLLVGRTTPTETVCWILALHRTLIPRELWDRDLIFFGSGRQVTGDASVRCLRYHKGVVSTVECVLLDDWTANFAALVIDDAVSIAA
ncbi:MAG TPA: hypothetical protein VFY28_03395 [Candidatus Paceibacterota bacterium]|nr:hypothetical protein [Candidatus Paceibacterota bacterium]